MKKVKIITWRLTDWWFDGRQKKIHITDIKRHKRYLMKWDWLVVWWKVPRMLVPVTSTALPLKWKIFRLLWDKKITLYCFVIVVSSVTLTCNCLITRTVVEYFSVFLCWFYLCMVFEPGLLKGNREACHIEVVWMTPWHTPLLQQIFHYLTIDCISICRNC